MLRILLFLVIAAFAVPAQAQSQYRVLPESRILIDGSSTVSPFTCEAGKVEGWGTLPRSALLAVTVSSFDCGNSRMNADFIEALRADAHPAIVFTFEAARLVSAAPAPDAWHTLEIDGQLNLAGVSRHVTVTLQGRQRRDGRVQARGRLPLDMRHYNVTPPTALLGLVRANAHVKVRFDLVAVPVENITATQ